MTHVTMSPIDVTVVGGGMIVHDQILPSLYHLQRDGAVGRIAICATSTRRTRELVVEPTFAEAFPGQSFEAHPSLDTPPEERSPELYREVIERQRPRQLVFIATPDPLHDEMIRLALENDQHVAVVKPLVQTHAQAMEIAETAYERGLFVGVEYHKRRDRRALDAKRQYALGRFGEFRLGEAKMIEPYCYRASNFQNWFTKDAADPFTYVGCHYVDLVYFLTGLRPVEVAVVGVEGRFPNGTDAWLWANGRVTWENGAVLSSSNGLGYPDRAAGANDQGLVLYCEGPESAAVLRHDDQYRGVRHGYVDDASGAAFRFINPDYFRLVPWEGEGLMPVGYGYDSIEALIDAARLVNTARNDLSSRQAVLRRIDAKGLIATPGNSSINELVVEAARLSIARNGMPVEIVYGETPGVKVRGS